MKRIVHTPLLMIASMFVLTACSDPVIGDWEADDGPVCDGSERYSEFEVDDELKLDGKIWVVAEGYCYECDIEGDIEDKATASTKPTWRSAAAPSRATAKPTVKPSAT